LNCRSFSEIFRLVFLKSYITISYTWNGIHDNPVDHHPDSILCIFPVRHKISANSRLCRKELIKGNDYRTSYPVLTRYVFWSGICFEEMK